MPTTYAHYKFGKDVLRGLPELLRRAIESNRELYDIGLHGPDILFYYKVPSKNRVNTLGEDMHDAYADEFFRHAAKVIGQARDKDAAQAYICGFICHFALDSECHKYIEKMIQVSRISHYEIEMEFDRLLLVEDSCDPVRHLSVSHIHPSRKNAEVIAPFFDGVTVKEVESTLASQIFVHRTLLAPGHWKRRFLFLCMKLAGLYGSHRGMVMSREPNPACREYCLLLKQLYAGAVPLAVRLILEYQNLLLHGAPLPDRFHETFGHGEGWEELSV